MGIVVVFDDLTDFEKAQRMAAWREVARRIAHEVKNPLTPIKLSAQTVRRKYRELLEHLGIDAGRMHPHHHRASGSHEAPGRTNSPTLLACRGPTPSRATWDPLWQDSIALYRHNYPHITFSLGQGRGVPHLEPGPEQFKQVMINLLENAIQAMERRESKIACGLIYNDILKIAILECADTGHGLSSAGQAAHF